MTEALIALNSPSLYPDMPEENLEQCVRLWIQKRLEDSKGYLLTSPVLATRTQMALLKIRKEKEELFKEARTEVRIKNLKRYIRRVSECLNLLQPVLQEAPPPPFIPDESPFAVLQTLDLSPTITLTTPLCAPSRKHPLQHDDTATPALQKRIDILEADLERQTAQWQKRHNEQVVAHRQQITATRQKCADALAKANDAYQDILHLCVALLDDLAHHRYLKKERIEEYQQRLADYPARIAAQKNDIPTPL